MRNTLPMSSCNVADFASVRFLLEEEALSSAAADLFGLVDMVGQECDCRRMKRCGPVWSVWSKLMVRRRQSDNGFKSFEIEMVRKGMRKGTCRHLVDTRYIFRTLNGMYSNRLWVGG